MNIAIIGSREGFTTEDVKKVIDKEFNYFKDVLITGGARGVDTLAENYINDNPLFDMKPVIIRPVNPANKLDHLFRNIEIITIADKIIAFWDGTSKGTKFVIDYAKARNKDITVIKKNEN